MSTTDPKVDYIRLITLAKLGEQSLSSNNYQEAINNLKEFFEIVSRNSFDDIDNLVHPSAFNLALSYSRLDDHRNAVRYWTYFISMNDSNADSYIERCNSYFELGKNQEALLDIKKAVQLRPNNSGLHINSGIAYIRLGDKLNARSSLQKALELGNPDAQQYIDNYC